MAGKDYLIPTYKKISVKYKHFMQEINTVWESFEVINFYTKILHNKIKKNQCPLPVVMSLSFGSDKKTRTYKKERMYGTLFHIKEKKNPRSALIESTLIFEDYISSVVEMVYRDYPHKALSDSDNYGNQTKVISIILSSDDKQEIIDRLLEIKIRQLFYGNISDIFLKDRAKMELKDTFTVSDRPELISRLSEIIARRNIYIHNSSRVDSKYIKESGNKLVKVGNVLKSDAEYIKDTINVFSQIATLFTVAVIKNIYKQEPKSNALSRTYWRSLSKK